MKCKIQHFSSILHFSETHALLPPLVPQKQCETATCLLKEKTNNYLSHFWLRAGWGKACSVFLNIPHYIHASLLRILYAIKHKMFGVKPQEVHTVILKIKRFTLSSTTYAKQKSKMHCLPLLA